MQQCIAVMLKYYFVVALLYYNKVLTYQCYNDTICSVLVNLKLNILKVCY